MLGVACFVIWSNSTRSVESYMTKPISFFVSTSGGKVDEARLEQVLPELMDLTPRGIRTHLNLNRPIYARTAAYGHFGREPEADGGFSWEKTDLVGELRGLA